MKNKLIFIAILLLSIIQPSMSQTSTSGDTMSKYDIHNILYRYVIGDHLDSLQQYITTNHIDVDEYEGNLDDYINLMDCALYRGESNIVQYLMSVSKSYKTQFPELHIAALNKDFNQVYSLIKNEGVDIDTPAQNGMTVLLIAALYGEEQAVRTLLSMGANPNKQDLMNTTPLIQVVVIQNEVMVKLLIQSGADVNQLTEDDTTALTQACFLPNNSIIQMLLDAGADPNIKTYLNPLVAAVSMGNIEAVQMLIAVGADLDSVDIFGLTPLMAAVCFDGLEGLVELTDDDEINALLANKIVILKLLIDAGADLTIKTDFSPLMYTTKSDNVDAAKMLLDAGVDINELSSDGETALIYGIQFNAVNVIKLLIDSGADLNIRNLAGDTALSLAQKMDDGQQIAELLIQAGAEY